MSVYATGTVLGTVLILVMELTRAEICLGGDSCCRPDNLCYVNEGDCDEDADCVPGLVCTPNSCVGDTFDGFPFPDDCCQFPQDPGYNPFVRDYLQAYDDDHYDYVNQQQQEIAAAYGG